MPVPDYKSFPAEQLRSIEECLDHMRWVASDMRETTTRTKAVIESSRELIEQLAWEEQRLSKPAVRKAFLPITLREGMSVCWEIADVEAPLNDYCTTGPAARSTIVAPPDMPA